MSTDIKEIIGRKEDKVKRGRTEYDDSTLLINRFFGGKGNGRMLQLTITNDEGSSYIQLTRTQVKDLSTVLLQAFDDDIYPSE
jgi:hypothetical protein